MLLAGNNEIRPAIASLFVSGEFAAAGACYLSGRADVFSRRRERDAPLRRIDIDRASHPVDRRVVLARALLSACYAIHLSVGAFEHLSSLPSSLRPSSRCREGREAIFFSILAPPTRFVGASLSRDIIEPIYARLPTPFRISSPSASRKLISCCKTS